jgi:hypothetical protein
LGSSLEGKPLGEKSKHKSWGKKKTLSSFEEKAFIFQKSCVSMLFEPKNPMTSFNEKFLVRARRGGAKEKVALLSVLRRFETIKKRVRKENVKIGVSAKRLFVLMNEVISGVNWGNGNQALTQKQERAKIKEIDALHPLLLRSIDSKIEVLLRAEALGREVFEDFNLTSRAYKHLQIERELHFLYDQLEDTRGYIEGWVDGLLTNSYAYREFHKKQ